jgi:hypothetical protein
MIIHDTLKKMLIALIFTNIPGINKHIHFVGYFTACQFPDYMASDGKMVDGLERTWIAVVVAEPRYYPVSCLELLRKTNLTQSVWTVSQPGFEPSTSRTPLVQPGGWKRILSAFLDSQDHIALGKDTRAAAEVMQGMIIFW